MLSGLDSLENKDGAGLFRASARPSSVGKLYPVIRYFRKGDSLRCGPCSACRLPGELGLAVLPGDLGEEAGGWS